MQPAFFCPVTLWQGIAISLLLVASSLYQHEYKKYHEEKAKHQFGSKA